MTITAPPALMWPDASHPGGVVTMGDVWRLSDEAGVPACTVLRTLDQLEGVDAQHVSHGHQ